MPSINITLAVAAALTALTAAVPHAHHKVHEHIHARNLGLTPSMLERAQSPNGQCGGTTGFTCAAGFCCSEWGYCGQGEAYCGASSVSAVVSSKPASSSSKSTASSIKSTVSPSAGRVTVTSTQYVTGAPATVTALSGVQTKAVNHPTHGPPPHSSSTSSASSTSTVIVHSSSSSSTSVFVAPSSTLPSKATTFSPTTTFVTLTTSSSAAAAPTTTSKTTSSSTSAAAPTTTSSGGSGLGDTYTMYTGDGTTASGWPSQSSWTNFESMWTNNLALISISCTQFGESNNSDEESDDIKSAIQSVASSSGVDERFILAIMMQESKGCVRAPTTNYGVTNPGLMQSHDGTGSCNNGGVQDPCPQSEITQMIKDGATGTAAGDGLEQCLSESKATDVSEYYKAARIYNSGSIAASGALEAGIATHCYASDIANRLTGWVNAATKCTLD